MDEASFDSASCTNSIEIDQEDDNSQTSSDNYGGEAGYLFEPVSDTEPEPEVQLGAGRTGARMRVPLRFYS